MPEIAPLRAGNPPMSVVSVNAAMKELQFGGSSVELVYPDDATQAVLASAGGNVLDPSIREAAARTAREQGRRIASERIASFWR
ncbi:MAG: hypothetical protein ACLPYS_00030 [Vulcanimicrobiaceae bacterium]